jgi:hypothetical protein
MLRSIGDIPRAEGEALRDPETALSCLQGFALGGLKGDADTANSGYFAVRGLLAKSVAEAARFTVDRGVVAEGGPMPVRRRLRERISSCGDWNAAMAKTPCARLMQGFPLKHQKPPEREPVIRSFGGLDRRPPVLFGGRNYTVA